jgi:putative ATPase
MRPTTLDAIAGQEHILGEGKLLRRLIQSDRMTSVIFYGPPGTGKTTLVRVISRLTKAHFVPLNAVEATVADLRRIIQEAKRLKNFQGHRTILFVDEIHRFNRAQQDVLMPDVEEGTLILIGATTQNPSFAINGPLLSRAVVFELNPLTEADLGKVLDRALSDREQGFGNLSLKLEPEARRHLIQSAVGDARRVLNALEVAVLTTASDSDGTVHITAQAAEESCQRKIVYHDREGDYHYDIASAFIKSMRGSDPDASLYWLAKMLYAGEDPRFIIRRILILASEDIGNADPQALILASAGLHAIEFVGLPEARLILAQLVTYMATAPKSNASYVAINEATADVKNQKIEEVPTHLRDAHYRSAEKMGHGVGYQYAHHYDDHFVVQEYWPGDKVYYRPTSQGFEKVLAERLSKLRQQTKDSNAL